MVYFLSYRLSHVRGDSVVNENLKSSSGDQVSVLIEKFGWDWNQGSMSDKGSSWSSNLHPPLWVLASIFMSIRARCKTELLIKVLAKWYEAKAEAKRGTSNNQ